ncbi:MAG TPA: putative toxin-antitoxin system toxin component, PIN family [Chloroflexota bacterium]|nr:putative toxin-antitoxin system toxin component, PIN family [Chloroflexota bacterium]
MRAVVDTNVWISAVLNRTGPPAAVHAALQRGRFVLISSEPLLAELTVVLARPRFAHRYGVTSADITNLVTLLRERAEIVLIDGTIHLCRDPDDDMVIETALNGRADALVTRDDDLKGESDVQAILAQRGIAVLTVSKFLSALEGTGTKRDDA